MKGETLSDIIISRIGQLSEFKVKDEKGADIILTRVGKLSDFIVKDENLLTNWHILIKVKDENLSVI